MEVLETGLEDSTTLEFAPGEYHLKPQAKIDSVCGNCPKGEEAMQEVTVGLEIKGHAIRITSGPHWPAMLVTNAGYGIWFKDCIDCTIENMHITGGVRDPMEFASDAAIVATRSSVRIENNWIKDNWGSESIIDSITVGIMGICGREGSTLIIFNNRLVNNSWDGIALYGDASATISSNWIEGDEDPLTIGGNGSGIGITWNARATLEGNYISGYGSGISSYADAQIEIHQNIIENIRKWGIKVHAGSSEGKIHGTIAQNVIWKIGACGLSLSTQKQSAGLIVKNNLIAKTGIDTSIDPEIYCPGCPVVIQDQGESDLVVKMVLYDNRRNRGPCDFAVKDVSKEAFLHGADLILEDFKNVQFLEQSEFYKTIYANSR